MEERTPTTIQPKVEPTTEHRDTETSPNAVADRNDANVAALGGFFNIHSPNIEEEDQLRYITDFFQRHGINHMAEIMMNVRHIESRLGAVPLHLSALQSIYNYLKTQSAIERLSQEQKLMER